MNSDVTVIFLDVLPQLDPGIIVGFHDIMLPYDYPTAWIERYYSEQYLLATFLLAGSEKIDILLANTFISTDPELSHILAPLWDEPDMKEVERHGSSFWFKIKFRI